MVAEGNRETTLALRCRQSRLLIWSDRITPVISIPSGMATSNG